MLFELLWTLLLFFKLLCKFLLSLCNKNCFIQSQNTQRFHRHFHADQLVDVFQDMFNVFLSQAVVLECFKATIILPVTKEIDPLFALLVYGTWYWHISSSTTRLCYSFFPITVRLLDAFMPSTFRMTKPFPSSTID